MIEIDAVTVRFGGLVALNEVSARLTAPVAGIIGPNGAGKTTLMNVVSGFITAKSGRVLVEGQDFLRLAPHRRAQGGLRRSFQKEQIADDLTVLENVLVQTDWSLTNARAKRAEAMEMLAVVGLADRAHKIGAALSGFERRLTDVARCMAGRPRLIMFDEPAGGLSVEETRQLGDLVLQIHGLTGAQTVIIDHDVELISRICAETLVLDFGRRIAFGPTAEVLADPKVKAAYLGTEEGMQ
ncbi:ABC transporter ATP-binding protein [Tabrizicola oligotrophica]|uniref:ATP-binding cassette domain-containing protein n=1 Tax=Tabrizicola oligotrophica TaxID=2710650 RepID=A0A6M0QRN2_9RHOB|nr:ATP-binding cassette domain-containing protein [Tabrizicola oligotrophica]NEY90145.1 ATP-binding cassette domain-containing protein [Tabrizicola oligotrophica]